MSLLFRIPCSFQGRDAYVVPDQIRTVDRDRLSGRIGAVAPQVLERTLPVLREMFPP